MSDEIENVKEKLTTVILPSYLSSGKITGNSKTSRLAEKSSKVEMLLHDKMPKILSNANKPHVIK